MRTAVPSLKPAGADERSWLFRSHIYSLQYRPTQHTALYTRVQRFCLANEACDTRNDSTHEGTALTSKIHGTLIHQSWCMPARGAAGAASGDLISIGRQDLPSFCSKLSGSIRRACEREAASGDRALVGLQQFTHSRVDQGGFETALRRITCGEIGCCGLRHTVFGGHFAGSAIREEANHTA